MTNNNVPPGFIWAENLFSPPEDSITVEENGTPVGLPVSKLNFTGSAGMTYDSVNKLVSVPIGSALGNWDGVFPSQIEPGVNVSFVCSGDGAPLTINATQGTQGPQGLQGQQGIGVMGNSGPQGNKGQMESRAIKVDKAERAFLVFRAIKVGREAPVPPDSREAPEPRAT